MNPSPIQCKKLGMLFLTAILSAGVGHAAQAPADTAASSPGYEVTPEMQRYREMGEFMDNMQVEMKKMSQSMAQPNLGPQQRKTMASQMKHMSSIMRRMSGLIDRPSMRGAEAGKELEAMRSEMAAMQKQHQEPLGKK